MACFQLGVSTGVETPIAVKIVLNFPLWLEQPAVVYGSVSCAIPRFEKLLVLLCSTEMDGALRVETALYMEMVLASNIEVAIRVAVHPSQHHKREQIASDQLELAVVKSGVENLNGGRVGFEATSHSGHSNEVYGQTKGN